MFTMTKKALILASKITENSFDYTFKLLDRLSDPEDPLVKSGNLINRVVGGTFIVSGVAISATISTKIGVGLCIAGGVSLASNLIYSNSIKVKDK